MVPVSALDTKRSRHLNAQSLLLYTLDVMAGVSHNLCLACPSIWGHSNGAVGYHRGQKDTCMNIIFSN